MDEAAELAKCLRGAMIAAAGCGKTQIIATAVSKHGGGRELVLTHTHAGVEAIRSRLVKFKVKEKACHVDTIAGWALRLATAFPNNSRLQNTKPRNSADYSAVYAAATRLLEFRSIREILHASYSGVYVDEYQDCTVEQHTLLVALLDTLPCRIVGDPLQGIFDFGDNKPIRWEEHVAPVYVNVPGPTTPWRWEKGNPELGMWLKDVRARLLAGQGIDLRDAPVRWLDGSDHRARQSKQVKACFDAAKNGGTVIAIGHWPNQCHNVASRLRGIYSCVEAIDTKDLYDFAHVIDSSVGLGRAVAVLDFAGKCITKVKTEFRTIGNSLDKGQIPDVRKNKKELQTLLAVADGESIESVAPALRALSQIPGAIVYRRELLRSMEHAALAVRAGDADNLTDAAWIVRNRTRQQGRLLSRCTVGTTLLVKGLEFDHAIVLDADSFDAQNLYVALTRGSQSLTIVSQSQIICAG
jgi:DNA helicase-2/ATP-dependent DNA helicase PcrA